MDHTDEAQLRELQDHPVLRGELQSKVLHGGKVVGLGHDVVLQLRRETRQQAGETLMVNSAGRESSTSRRLGYTEAAADTRGEDEARLTKQ